VKAPRRANRTIRIGGSSATTLVAPIVQRNYRQQDDSKRASRWWSWKAAKLHSFASVPLHQGATTRDVPARAKYEFEPDSDDDELENITEGDIDALAVAVHNVRNVAVTVGGKLDRQNDGLHRMERVADSLDDKLTSNTSKLQRF
jgi:hypothetical protein